MDSPTWLMLFYQLPAKPSTQRVYVWRKLKAWGAVYLQHSVCVLPANKQRRAALEELCREIESRKGEARVSTVQMTEPAECQDIVAKFKAQSDEEYEEFLGQCRDFAAELIKERQAEHYTFAELEENEAELGKLKGWLPKIRARDFFGGSLKAKAEKALKIAEQDLNRYARQVAAETFKKVKADETDPPSTTFRPTKTRVTG